MPPIIYSTSDDGIPKPLQYLHPGIRKSSEQIHQPHVFQQSVTLTASIWNENDSKQNMNWNFDNWRVLGKYSSLYVGLICGFGIVVLIMSTVMLWRYCVISASRKICCKSTYDEITRQQNSIPLRKERTENRVKFCPQSTLQRSATLNFMPWHNGDKLVEAKKPVRQVISTNNILSHLQSQATPSEPLMSADLYTSHLYLNKFETTSLEATKNFSKSAPALEDLYAKVIFSKKKKNRMRKNEAAVIAMSKSQSGQNNVLDFGSAVVVYNERTAL